MAGAVLPGRMHRGVATELMYTHYAVQWYVNASVTRDLDNLMRLVCEHTTKNIKKAHHFFSLSCLLHHRNEIMTSVCIKKNDSYQVYEIP